MKNAFFILCLLLNHLTTSFGQGDNYPEKCLTNHPSNDRYGSYAPDGKSIIFESDRNGNWDIFILEIASGNQRALTFSPRNERRPSWHPSGRKIIYEIEKPEGTDLYELDLYIGLSKRLLQGSKLEGDPMFPRYAPSGKQIAYGLQINENQSKVMLYDLEQSKYLALSDNAYRNTYPVWSPDGKDLLFFSRKDTDNQEDEIYRIQLKNGKWKRLTNWPKHNFCPAWSPDGQQIAYVTSMEDSRPEIYIMNKKGKKQKRITWNEDGETLPSWSPDGKKLLITAYRDGNYELCELDLSLLDNR